MKVHIRTPDGMTKECQRCNKTVFRKSTKSIYTNPVKTEGKTYDLLICDNCGFREQFNEIIWRVAKKE